jgi:hypothetical protein
VPVITTAQPELASAIGAGLKAARADTDGGTTAMTAAAPVAAMDATQMAPGAQPEEMGSSTFRALAWSEADDIPDVAPIDPYDYQGVADTDAVGGPRPQMQFAEPETEAHEAAGRRPVGLFIAGLIAVLAAIAVAVWFVLRNNESTPSPATTASPAPAPTPAAPTSAAPAAARIACAGAPPPVTQTVTRAPATVTQTQAPPPPPPTSAAPPPPPPATTQPPSSAPPSTRQPIIPTLPYETIPGLPFVPAPIQPPAPAPAP